MLVFVSFALGEIAAAISIMDIRLFVLVSIFMFIYVYLRGISVIMAMFMVCMMYLGQTEYRKYESDICKWDLSDSSSLYCVEGTVTKVWNGDKMTILGVGDTLVSYYNSDIDVKAVEGDYIKAEGNPKHFEIARNPGNFDEKTYYTSIGFTKKIQATKLSVSFYKHNKVYSYMMNIRDRYLQIISEIWEDKSAAIISAMTVGDKENMTDEVREGYRLSGLSHILAISGIHLSIIGLGVFKIFRRRFKYVISGMAGILTVIIFGVITGGSASVKRAVVMFIVGMIAQILGRTYDMVSAASLAAIIILFECPYAMYNAGFILSFGAVAGICIAQYLGAGKIFTLCIIQLTTMPVTLYMFYELPVYGIIVNIVAVPLVGVLLISGFCSGIIGMVWKPGGRFVAGIGYIILKIYDVIIMLVNKMPYNNVVVGQPEIQNVIVCVAVFALFVMIFGRWKKKYLAWLIALPPLWLCLVTMNTGVYVSIIDVGQGDCIVIRDKNSTYMIDAGSSDVANVYKYRIKSCLKAMGIKQIDAMIVTHMDSDHINAVGDMLDDDMIKFLYMPDIRDRDDTYSALVDKAVANRTGVKYISAGWKHEDNILELTCEYPYKAATDDDINELSVVIRMEYGRFSMMCMGDLGEKGENKILKNMSPCTILKAGHHGSKNSSGDEFLSRINPSHAVISCGVRNRYGHPHKETLDRFASHQITYTNTSEAGNIYIRINADGKCTVRGYIGK